MIVSKDPIRVIEEAQYLADVSGSPQAVIRAGLELTHTDLMAVDPCQVLEVIRPLENVR